jgi:hypothetical protein
MPTKLVEPSEATPWAEQRLSEGRQEMHINGWSWRQVYHPDLYVSHVASTWRKFQQMRKQLSTVKADVGTAGYTIPNGRLTRFDADVPVWLDEGERG